MHPSIFLLATIGASAVAKTIVIDAGEDGLVYSPDTISADVGDMLEFHFYGRFHTAVQGDFNTPCQMGSLVGSGFNSGPINNQPDGSGSVFQVAVQNTNPIWFYCGTPTHCQSGMVGVVNPPSSGNTLATYRSNAAGTSSSQLLNVVQGGVVVPANAASSESASSSPATLTTTVETSASAAAPSTTSAPESSSLSAASSSSETSEIPSSSPETSLPENTSTATETVSSGSTTVTTNLNSASQTASSSSASTSKATSTPAVVTTSEAGALFRTAEEIMLTIMIATVGFLIALIA